MTVPKRVIAGTRNAGKVRELTDILKAAGIAVESLERHPDAPDVEETGTTFEENARLKALTLAKALGQAVIADDSGLEVDALGGRPGVHSARFAGPTQDPEANKVLLLRAMENVPDGERTARFRCAVCLATPEGVVAEARGATEGTILRAPRGTGGFGYDPLFLSDDLGVSFAQANGRDKNRVSHRGRAFQELLRRLPASS